MTALDLSSLNPEIAQRYPRYLAAANDARIALEVMRDLPDYCEPVRELTAALARVIETVRALDLPLDGKTEILNAIAAGGQS